MKKFLALILAAVMLLSCVLGELLVAAHLSDGLLYWATKMNLSPALMPLLIFGIGALVSLASGSSAAAITSLRPGIPFGLSIHEFLATYQCAHFARYLFYFLCRYG